MALKSFLIVKSDIRLILFIFNELKKNSNSIVMAVPPSANARYTAI